MKKNPTKNIKTSFEQKHQNVF